VPTISKKNRIGDHESPWLLKDKLGQALRFPLSLARREPNNPFRALKDISFEVGDGEVLGLITRNGASKSMLRPGGHFVISTPFLIEVQGAPTTCTARLSMGCNSLSKAPALL
jgi:hypothetical protein